jgi:dienelactone hydrolase
MRGLITIIVFFGALAIYGQEPVYTLDTLYTPAVAPIKNVAVVFWGGSEGGLKATPFEAKTLPELGYPTLKVGYFNTEHTPKKLERIPLDYVIEAIEAFKKRPDIEGKKIVISGISKGAELALLIGSVYQGIDGILVTAPSAVAWQSITGMYRSSWSYLGKEVDFMPYAPFDYSKIEFPRFIELYDTSLNQETYLEKALIKVENASCPIFIFSGEEDVMWPSVRMGNMIVERLNTHDFKHAYTHYTYPDANHALWADGVESLGGTVEGNTKAYMDFCSKFIAFLDKLNKS